MKTLTSALLFNLFISYLEGMVQVVEELPAAYDNFVTLLGELPQNENQILKLRRLNYTKIELASIQIASEQMLEKRHVLYDVLISPQCRDRNGERVIQIWEYYPRIEI